MKRFTTILSVALLATSCLNYDDAPLRQRDGLVAVTFNVTNPQSGPITKASNEAIQAAVDAVAVYPEVQTITLTDTSDETKQYTATPGVELLLPVGTYRATAERDGTVATTCPLGTVYNEPCFGIAQTVEVTRQTHDITLTGIARCYAIVLDRSTTYAYRIHTGNIIDALAIFPAGDIATVFVKPSTGGTAGIVAIGTGGDEKEYNVSWLTTTGGTHLDTGCWYCFPGPATKVGTTLAVTHGAWTAGTIAN